MFVHCFLPGPHVFAGGRGPFFPSRSQPRSLSVDSCAASNCVQSLLDRWDESLFLWSLAGCLCGARHSGLRHRLWLLPSAPLALLPWPRAGALSHRARSWAPLGGAALPSLRTRHHADGATTRGRQTKAFSQLSNHRLLKECSIMQNG